MEHKTFSFEIKSVDYTGRTVEGFAAAFGNIDQVGDIIHPGAFKKTLTERGGKIKFLWQHDPNEPIGRLVEAREESGGLAIKAIISDTARGRDALALLRDNAIGEMSIGYDAVKGGSDYSKAIDGRSIRNLREIKLYEISLVTFPANEAAVVTGVKQQDIMPSEAKPYRNVPEELTDKMDSCVEKVMAKGDYDKETAIAICYTSVVEGKSLAESFLVHGLEYPAEEKMDFVSDDQRRAVFASLAEREADNQSYGGHLPMGHENYFKNYSDVDLTDEFDERSNRVKKYIDDQRKLKEPFSGDLSERLDINLRQMNYITNEAEKRKLTEWRKMRAEHDNLREQYAKINTGIYKSVQIRYTDQDEPIQRYQPEEVKVGRTISRATLSRLKAAREVIDELCAMGETYSEEEEEPEEKTGDSHLLNKDLSGPGQPPNKLLSQIEISLSELELLEVKP